MAARADPLRSTLDNLQLDPRSEADRPYLVAMLRRLGYTEREIEEVVRTGKMPEDAAQRDAPADDGLAPPRDFRLVVPARDSRFALDSTAAASADSPFEDLERLEFEDPQQDLVFEPLQEGEAGEPPMTDEAGQPLAWQQSEEGGEPESAPDERLTEASREEDRAGQPAEGPAGFDESPIDTFGGDQDLGAGAGAAAAGRTRVRVRRVRAASREEAERKVGTRDRKVLKSVPVDIVERWGAQQGQPKSPPAPPADETKGE